MENLRFVTFVVNTLMALYKNNALFKAATASATNAHRLGANEAPPAIISSFLGKQVSDIQRIIADKTAENATDRTFRCSFSLKPLRYSNTAQYYLIIANEQEQTPTIREEFQIDIAFDGEDFDY